MKTLCVIPARFASTRLPGKPLALIAGKPMIQWVYERAKQADLIDKVVVATDNNKIDAVVREFGGQVVMTPENLPSGTDRVAYVAQKENAEIVINLQGDEPFVSTELLNKMVQVFSNPEIEMATPVKKITEPGDLKNPNLVQVVRDNKHFALYFSRSIIPYVRDIEKREDWINKQDFYKHIGIYAYRKHLLIKLTNLPQSGLESAEKLEQLRALENGIQIYTVETAYESVGVDTKEDLELVNNLIKHNKYEIDGV